MGNILELVNLRTEIKLRKGVVHAVDDVSLSIASGETLGLVGESGSGKTMTGMSIMRLLPAGGRIAGGSIKLDGHELMGLSEKEMQHYRGNEVSVIFQDPMTSLDPTMTIGRQIAESVSAHRDVSRPASLARAAEVLDLVGMPQVREQLGSYPHQLSGGMRQRVMIAMALACEPKLLIADEPTTALDVTIQEQILDLLDDLKSRLNLSVLLISHDLGVVSRYADRVAVMYAGKLVETGPAAVLFRRMRHRYTEALVEAVPRHDQDTRGDLYSIPGVPPDLTDPPRGCRFAPRCRYAQDDCHQQEPRLEAADIADHRFACFHPVRHDSTTTQIDDNAAREELIVEGKLLVEVDRVSKEYPVTHGMLQRRTGVVHAVSEVSFSIMSGETFGLVGESGCGKSTLGRQIVGLEKPTSGGIVFNGRNISALSSRAMRPVRRNLQLMFQDPYASLDPRMRVGSILREPLAIHNVGSHQAQNKRISELLDEVGLRTNSAELYPHEFSGGQRQRIGLARALALEPQVIVADEPVSALDVSVQAQILNLMRRLRKERHLTYVIISHDLSVIRYMCHRIGVMYLGKMVEVGLATDVCERPAHPYTLGLLEALPEFDSGSSDRGPDHHGTIQGELPSAINPPSGCRFRTRCPLAQEICAQQEPPLRSFGPGHFAACHFPYQQPTDQTAESVSI